jgi:DNA-binding NtrC family response regulator
VSNWISVETAFPPNQHRVLAMYKGVYGPRVVTYWYDGVNHHFGNPPTSEPATHWHYMPDDDPMPRVGDMVKAEVLETAHIAAVIEKTETLDHAARVLGIDIATLYRKRRKHNMPMRFTTGEKK